MSSITIVLCHREGQEAFNRHLQYWKAITDELMVYSPEDSRIETKERQVSFGNAIHQGPHAIERIYWILRWMEGTDHDQFLFHEYDSISFAKPGVFALTGSNQMAQIQGNWKISNEGPRWIGSQYIHPPWAMNRDGLEGLVAAFGRLPFHANRGLWDRFIGAACQLHGLPAIQFGIDGSAGYSVNTIVDLDEAADKVRKGARHIHGIKSPEALRSVLSAL